MGKEVVGIKRHGTCRFLEPGAEPSPGYQEAPLCMIFDIKPDLRRKSRLVLGGHLVDASGHISYSSVVRMEGIRLLNVITQAQKPTNTSRRHR